MHKKQHRQLWRHVKYELEFIGEEKKIINKYLEIVDIFDTMGHSGSSAVHFIETLGQLLWFKNLADLTNNPGEWERHSEAVAGTPGGIWQNRRNGAAFSNDGGKTYYILSETKKDSKGNLIKKFYNSVEYAK